MKNQFYSDNRDLVKWSILVHLAEIKNITKIIQIAYKTSSSFEPIYIGREEFDISDSVLNHFRNISLIKNLRFSKDGRVILFDEPFDCKRDQYHHKVLKLINKHNTDKSIIFLDPDNGLQPQNANYKHVKWEEVKEIWQMIKKGSFLAIYQHQFRELNWAENKKRLLAQHLAINDSNIKIGRSKIARDMVVYIIKK